MLVWSISHYAELSLIFPIAGGFAEGLDREHLLERFFPRRDHYLCYNLKEIEGVFCERSEFYDGR